MLVIISEIKIGPGRREVALDKVKELAKSIEQIGLLNPITISNDHTLIAGGHRLEAAKQLGWTEIECTVSDLSGLLAELAEIDENFVRNNLSTIEYGNLLLRRKEIYEILHPETKATYNGGPYKGNQHDEVTRKMRPTSKAFSQDMAEKLGVSKSTIEREIQTAKNLTPETKQIIKNSNSDISKTNALKLSRLEPKQQEQAATQLVTGEIKSVDEYKKPYSLGDKVFATLEESIADLKNPNKDTRYTPDTLLADMDGFIDRFHKDFGWYNTSMCREAFPAVNKEQLDYIKNRFAGVTSAVEKLLQEIERSMTNDK